MDTVISLLVVLLSLTNLVVPQAPSVTSFRAVVEVLSRDLKIFSGESIRLKCSVPDNRSRWNYLWFRGAEQLPQTSEHLVLWKARVQESGKYYCQGWRDTVVGKIYTLQSVPEEISVDGGWAILQIPARPSLVGDTLKITCRIRANPPLEEVVLYKDGVEVMRQKGPLPHFHLTNVTLKEQGTYCCRASWDIERRTRSVISSEVPVKVLEVLTEPVLEIDTDVKPGYIMKVICHVTYNIPAPAPPINYYFYKNTNQLGVAKSRNYDLVPKAPGMYSCRAKVPLLDIFRWSEPKAFPELTGQMMKPEPHHPRDPHLSARSVSSPDLSLPAAAEPTASSQRPDRFLKDSRPSPGTSLSAVQFVN